MSKYINYRYIECAQPLLSNQNFIIALLFTLTASGGYWLLTIAENKEFMQVSDSYKATGIRAIIYTPSFAYWFLATMGIASILLVSLTVFMELYVITK